MHDRHTAAGTTLTELWISPSTSNLLSGTFTIPTLGSANIGDMHRISYWCHLIWMTKTLFQWICVVWCVSKNLLEDSQKILIDVTEHLKRPSMINWAAIIRSKCIYNLLPQDMFSMFFPWNSTLLDYTLPMVQKGKFAACAVSDPTNALNKVLLPTLGRPTMPVWSFIESAKRENPCTLLLLNMNMYAGVTSAARRKNLIASIFEDYVAQRCELVFSKYSGDLTAFCWYLHLRAAVEWLHSRVIASHW